MEIEDIHRDPRLILDAADWDAFLVDGWSFSTAETPGKLRDILSGDHRTVVRGVDHLTAYLIHQGTPGPSTIPAARYVAAVLAGPVSDDADAYIRRPDSHTSRWRMLGWLDEVAYTVSTLLEAKRIEQWGLDAAPSGPVFDGIRRVRPELFAGVLPWIADPMPDVRDAALFAAMNLADDPRLAAYRPEVARQISEHVLGAADPTHPSARAVATVLGGWGEDVAALQAAIEPEQPPEAWAGPVWNSEWGSVDEPPF
ncbi:hypothetical protein [Yinghuangia soli]|uniref:Uncharacterized protein n=1 Tax=Yinghuangia soli TaxID=2908204 RepID=A0AA41PVX9_9ACTN|nr:hypothetical protein [Yinghuangia soli]MCF2526176.1 hypothetical protein [Yinghuangia soli]